MLTPEIDRATHINRISIAIDRQVAQRQRLIDLIGQMSNDPYLLQLCFHEKVVLAVNGEMIEASIDLLNKAIRKLETSNNQEETVESSSSSSSSSSHAAQVLPFDLSNWFKLKLTKRLEKLKDGARETASTYVKERNASSEVRENYTKESITKLEEHHERVLNLFEHQEKTCEGMRLLLNELERQSSSLEKQKDQVSSEIVRKAEPVADFRAETAELSRAITILNDLKEQYQRLELKPEEKLNIFEASQFGHVRVVREAIENGTNVNIVDERGFGMLHIAAFANQYVIVDLLLCSGANHALLDRENYPPIYWAANRGSTDIVDRLHRAAIQRSNGRSKALRSYINFPGGLAQYCPKPKLTSRKSKVITQSINRTPLHTAAYHGRHRTLKLLLGFGGDPNLQTSDCDNKKTPLIEAILLAGSILDQMAAILAAAGNDIDVQETQNDFDRCFETIKILLKHPDINLNLQTVDNVTGERKTAFHHAIDIGVDTCATGIIDSLLHYPRTGSSIYIKNKKLFAALLEYAHNIQTKKQAPHRPAILRTLRTYEVMAKAEKMRQDNYTKIDEQRAHIYHQIVRNNPSLAPQEQNRLLEGQLSRRKQQIDQQVNEFEELEMRRLETFFKTEFPSYYSSASAHQTVSSPLPSAYRSQEVPLPSEQPRLIAATSSSSSQSSPPNENDIRISSEPSSSLADVTKLILSGRNIDDEKAIKLAKSLENNPNITELDLSENQIGDKGATALAKALRQNSILRILNLDSNLISLIGAKEFATVLDQNTTLTTLTLEQRRSFSTESGLAICSEKINTALARNKKLKEDEENP